MKATTVRPVWIKFEDYAKYFQNIKAGTYALAFCDNIPANNVWPHQVEGVYYIGESATTEPTIDRKNKNKPDKGKLEYAFFKRLKDHMTSINNADKQNTTWRKLFFRYFGYGSGVVKGTLTGKTCYLCVLICPDDVKHPKSWVKRVEQELIDEYLNTFDFIPLLNTKERNGSSDSMKNKNSHSQRLYEEMKRTSIENFLDV